VIEARLEGDTALGLCVFGHVAGGDVAVGQHYVGQWPAMPGWLQIEE
jgi:hypothetical protein